MSELVKEKITLSRSLFEHQQIQKNVKSCVYFISVVCLSWHQNPHSHGNDHRNACYSIPIFLCLYHSSFTHAFILYYHSNSKTYAHTNKGVLSTDPEQFPIIFPTHKLNYIYPVVIQNAINVHCYDHVILCIKYYFVNNDSK